MEKDERRGALTLKTMQRVAKAMGCGFEYRIAPLSDKPVAAEETSLQSSAKPLSSGEKPRIRVLVK